MESLPGLATKLLGRSYRRLEAVSSTNDYLRENAVTLPDGAAVTAAFQTGGKGRRGKSWHAKAGDCLMLSALFHAFPPSALALLPLVTGVAVADAVQEMTGVEAALKWSNDVLLENKKVCGILCESRVSGGEAFAVAGIGINLRQTREEFSRLGLSYASSLAFVTENVPEEEEAAAITLNHLEARLLQYREGGFGAILPRYKELCVNLGRPVRVTVDGEEREGLAVDITPEGALLCEIGGKRVAVTAGESSVRGLYGYI